MTLQPARLLVALIAAIALPVFAQNLAVVNGKAIPSAAADKFVKQAVASGQQQDTPELRKKVKEHLIQLAVLSQEAEKQGVGKKDEVKEQVEQARQQIMVQALIASYMEKNKPSDADIAAEYKKQTSGLANEKEYNARHILVEKEEEAKAIIAKLKAGGKFEELAKGTKDTGSAANGGSLDWSPASNYVPEFGNALKALKKGEMTDTPVKTQYGYHIIKLEDTRPVKAPSLEEVKPRIAQFLGQQKVKVFIDDLQKKAVIK